MTASTRFFEAYVECALWSSNDESNESGGLPLDRNYSVDDIEPETLARMRTDCDAFVEANASRWHTSVDDRAGHDFWLTRNGHGAGFWDGDWDDVTGKALTEASKKFGETNLYVADNGKIGGHE